MRTTIEVWAALAADGAARRVNRLVRHADGTAEASSESWIEPESGQPFVVVEPGRVLMHVETRERLTLARRLF